MQQTTTHFPYLFSRFFFFSLFVFSILLPTQVCAVNDTEIDFSTVPACARRYCLEQEDSPYTWTRQNLCPPSSSSSSSSGILPSCFCNSPRPLICLPYDPTVPNPCYSSLRSWYNTLCASAVGSTTPPPSTTLPYRKLPICARPCARMMTSHLGCPDHSLSCACQLSYLAGNTAECIRSTCQADIQTYIGDLTAFTAKWLYQSCEFTDSSPGVGIRSTTEAYRKSPAAHPQEVLADDFMGVEYTSWQAALDAKRAKKSNLGVIIPLSLVFGGIFGVLALQWLAACCGCGSTVASRRRWDRVFRVIGEVLGWVGGVIAWVWKGVVFVSRWVWDGCKAVWKWIR